MYLLMPSCILHRWCSTAGTLNQPTVSALQISFSILTPLSPVNMRKLMNGHRIKLNGHQMEIMDLEYWRNCNWWPSSYLYWINLGRLISLNQYFFLTQMQSDLDQTSWLYVMRGHQMRLNGHCMEIKTSLQLWFGNIAIGGPIRIFKKICC